MKTLALTLAALTMAFALPARAQSYDDTSTPDPMADQAAAGERQLQADDAARERQLEADDAARWQQEQRDQAAAERQRVNDDNDRAARNAAVDEQMFGTPEYPEHETAPDPDTTGDPN